MTKTGWLLLAAVLPSTLAAQHYGLREVRDVGSAGINVVVARPVGDFQRNVDVAGGVNVFGALNVGRSGALAIRLDGSYLVYGNDHAIVTLPYYPLGLTTTYAIATVGLGPQITFGAGSPVQLYGFGTLGVSYFSATTSFDLGGCGCAGFADRTDYDDWTPAVQGGGGITLILSRRRNPVALDLGARYLSNGEVSYVTPGGVIEQANGGVIVTPTRTRADLVTFHLGVSVGLR
jgi:hypothetical protein